MKLTLAFLLLTSPAFASGLSDRGLDDPDIFGDAPSPTTPTSDDRGGNWRICYYNPRHPMCPALEGKPPIITVTPPVEPDPHRPEPPAVPLPPSLLLLLTPLLLLKARRQ